MTISSTNRKAGPFVGNGVVSLFPFSFKVFKTSDVLVTFTDTNGADRELVLDSDYSVTLNNDQDNNPGGVVTYPRAGSPGHVLAAPERLTVTGDLAALQPTDLPDLSPWFPHVVEDAFDRATILIQQLQEQVNRSIKISVSDTPLTPLPTAPNRANELIGFDAMGNVVLYPLTSSIGAGDRTSYSLTAGVDFNAGDTHVILPRAPGTQGNLEVNFDAAPQDFTQWTVSGTDLNFATPIPAGITRIWGYIGTTLSTEIPPLSSVGDTQILWSGILNRVVGSIAELRTLDKAKYNRAFAISYYAGAAKGGGAYWKRYDTAPGGWENGGSQIVANDGAGWELQFQSTLSAEQFGLKADNATDAKAAIQAAIIAMYNAGGGEVLLPAGNIKLSDTVLMYPYVTLRGQGKGRTYIQYNGAPASTIFRTNTVTPGLLSIGGGLSEMTINGVAIPNGNTAFDISDGQQWRAFRVEFANCLYGIHFNKYATASGSAFGGQAYFNTVEQCEFASCSSDIAFGGAANRNTISTNTHRNSNVAFDFGIAGNVSETNVFINENVEGCHSWAEWAASFANVYTQTWIGLTVENPTTNGYACSMRDPGRQNFVGLAIIPANNPAAVSFFSIFNDGSGKPIRSDVFGTMGSSGAYTGYGNRSNEDIHLLGGAIRTRMFGTAPIPTQTIASGNYITIAVSVPGAVVGDTLSWSIDQSFPTLQKDVVLTANGTATFTLFNQGGVGVPVNGNVYVSVAGRATNL